jgi:hypothetical protein
LKLFSNPTSFIWESKNRRLYTRKQNFDLFNKQSIECIWTHFFLDHSIPEIIQVPIYHSFINCRKLIIGIHHWYIYSTAKLLEILV